LDRAATAKRYRHQAEEFRTKAEMMADEDARLQYVKVADAFDGLADNEEKLLPQKVKPSQLKR
jgi:hypothetical protein